ncbi:MAG TPA: TetR/AcrR family transcriptional regulator [Aquaticitalea sp.]|nr:TetR/AcrR family transcriptional regulator [Aquaticitalea sp.]HNU58978.1 TetR/AcrR family transcriptional regulator [Aquaticitalea sp.]
MSIQKKEDATYELIISTAKNLFFKEGKFNATTQEIADAAGVNRTLINYYFRSRDALFDLIFEEGKKEDERRQEMIVLSDLPIREKLEMFIDYFLSQAKMYPYREVYMLTQIIKDDCCIYDKKEHVKRMSEKFYVELEQEMEKGTIQKMKPIQFMLNFISMLIFPVIMRPFLQNNFELDDKEYDKLLAGRREVILKTIFRNREESNLDSL